MQNRAPSLSLHALSFALALFSTAGCSPSGSPSATTQPASVPGASAQSAPHSTPSGYDRPGNFVAPSSPAAPNGDLVKITSINGIANPRQAAEVNVRPGDMITLTADLFLAGQNFAPALLPVEAFRWSSNLSAQDACDVSLNGDCLAHSNFQVSNGGMSFYVPYVIPERIQILVRPVTARGSSAVYDTVILRNMDHDGRKVPTPSLVLNPIDYPGSSLDPNLGLVGMGRWVIIGNTRYFTPYSYVTVGEEEWVPYRHGYWAWESRTGLTWISYDPWGWMTDHYGIWRHHATYGWLWLPFEDHHYEPHCVSWIDHGDYIGWYPYHDRYREAYAHRQAEGFDDGFWLGFRAGVNFGQPGYAYHPGFAIVPRAQFTNVNLINVVINKTIVLNPLAVTVIMNSAAQRRVFAVPGGGDRFQARSFVERTSGQTMPTALAATITTKGGAKFVQAQPTHVLAPPPESSAFLQHINPIAKPVSVGSVVQTHNGGVQVIPPMSSGRGIIAPPVVHNEAGTTLGTLPVKSTTPAQVIPNNPITAPPAPKPSLAPVPEHKLPPLNPTLAAPPAALPKTFAVTTANPTPTPVTTPPPARAAPVTPLKSHAREIPLPDKAKGPSETLTPPAIHPAK